MAVTPLPGCEDRRTQGSVGSLPEGQGALGPPPHQRGLPLVPQSLPESLILCPKHPPCPGAVHQVPPSPGGPHALGSPPDHFRKRRPVGQAAGVTAQVGRGPWEHWERPVQGSVLSAQSQPPGTDRWQEPRSWGLGRPLLPLPGPLCSVPPQDRPHCRVAVSPIPPGAVEPRAADDLPPCSKVAFPGSCGGTWGS